MVEVVVRVIDKGEVFEVVVDVVRVVVNVLDVLNVKMPVIRAETGSNRMTCTFEYVSRRTCRRRAGRKTACRGEMKKTLRGEGLCTPPLW